MRRFTLILLAFIGATLTFAQTPEAFNYQAVVRDGNGDLVKNTPISVMFRILDNNEPQNVVYSETHSGLTTNDYGLFTANIGIGTASTTEGTEDFSSIEWGKDKLFIEVSINKNDEGYITIGTQELKSVPYALHSKTAEGLVMGDGNEEALFEVKNASGDPIFSVFNGGVRILVDETDDSKLGRPTQGFVVAGLRDVGKADADTVNYLTINTGSVNFQVETDNTDKTQPYKTGFKVGGLRDVGKADYEYQDLLSVSFDSIRMYINDVDETEAIKPGERPRAGFAIAGLREPSAKITNGFSYFSVTPDSTRIYFRDTLNSGFEFGIVPEIATEMTDTMASTSLINITGQHIILGANDMPKSTIAEIFCNRNIFVGRGIGSGASRENDGYNDNIIIGYKASPNSIDSKNIIIGNNSALSKISGDNSVIIGNNAGNGLENIQDAIIIGNYETNIVKNGVDLDSKFILGKESNKFPIMYGEMANGEKNKLSINSDSITPYTLFVNGDIAISHDMKNFMTTDVISSALPVNQTVFDYMLPAQPMSGMTVDGRQLFFFDPETINTMMGREASSTINYNELVAWLWYAMNEANVRVDVLEAKSKSVSVETKLQDLATENDLLKEENESIKAELNELRNMILDLQK